MTANLGALTTTFTPYTSDCLTSVFYGSNTIGSWLQLGLYPTSSCLPDNFGRDASLFYSPGICPSGYSYACTMATTSDTEDITIATCCPSGYYCRASMPASQVFPCLSSFTSAATLAVSSYSFRSGSVPSGTTTVTVTSGETVRAYGPIVRRASSDPAWTNALPASTASATPGSAATAASTASTAPASSSGLSTGAKAGIGVGVSAGVLLVVGACVLGFVIGKRAMRRGEAARVQEALQREREERERQGEGKTGNELLGEEVQEMSAAQERQELYPSQISELDGTQRK